LEGRLLYSANQTKNTAMDIAQHIRSGVEPRFCNLPSTVLA